MKTRFFLTFSLLAVFIIPACASSATATQAVVKPSETALAIGSPPVDLNATQVSSEGLSSATQPVDVQPIATSRGPELHATDPMTVSLASGQIQFVEFFRFT